MTDDMHYQLHVGSRMEIKTAYSRNELIVRRLLLRGWKSAVRLCLTGLLTVVSSWAQGGHLVPPPPPPGIKKIKCSGRPIPQLEDA